MKLKPAALAALALLSGLATSSFAQDRKTYIVQLKDEPAATYQGTLPGLEATQPAAGSSFKYGSAAVQNYLAYLSQQQSNVIALVGNAPVIATYDTVFNGFAARLTQEEALALRGNAAVVDVFEDEPRKLDTISTSKFLGLSTAGGLWSKNIGGVAINGEDMVIGVVDGGIWPESPAFADRVDGAGVPTFDPAGTRVYGPPPATFKGGCQAGDGFVPATHCNNKLIGAKFFNSGFLATGAVQNWSEFASPRDSLGGSLGHGGHGDHTASTAAGNNGATAIVNGLALGTATGMAPRARVAAYKVCWTRDDAAATDGTGSSNSCYTTDSVAAIDAAVKDGVNVINYSISGSQTSVNDPVEQAFYRAAIAGVFVAASAGNSGPANQVAHISPWISTIAASTHDRAFTGTVKLGNGASYTGGSLNPTALPPTSLILAEEAGVAGASANLKLCFSSPNELDPAKVAGKIVVCTRGSNARVDKGAAVAAAGGVGMVLVNAAAGQTVDADAQPVPTVQVSNTDGAAIKAYAAGGAGKGEISRFAIGTKPAPQMASFSSRGPNQGDSNVLKPDITAPGVDVIASVTPQGGATVAAATATRDAIVAGTLVPGPEWASYQGTSMSSPHVAGVALLLKQAHPNWSPAAIKSALMTTAYSTLDDGQPGAANGLLPWSQGAGHIDPNKANDPGLVYDAGKNDYIKYQCKVNRAAVTPASDCTTIGTLDETYNLNLPSITAGAVLVSATVTRRVTNVGATTATYNATASVPNFTTVVTPSSLTLAPGETKSFTVKLTPTASAVTNVWNFGSLTWTDGSHIVRSPVQARVGVPIVAPASQSGLTTSGSRLFTVKTGFNGRMGVKKAGLKDVTLGVPVTLTPGSLNSTALKAVCQAGVDTASTKVYNFSVPAGTAVFRAALRQADTSDASDDNDMILVGPDGASVYSGNDGSNEAVQLVNPAPGNYRVCVTAYGSANPTLTHRLSSWIVTTNDAGGRFNALVPSTVYAGSTATVGMSWSGLNLGGRYVGAAQWLDASGNVQATTTIRVEPGAPVLSAETPVSLSSKLVGSND
ncbi:MAG: peptidase S8 and S53 subtilisin kexin sedolisin [Burkholderiales bacterium]|nr:MAG: peptidase S8 and S53 subtilisin kexin sedolisin [Burkholderiales bacterium]